MFLHSRIILVDDNPAHITGLRDALNAQRLGCHPKVFDHADLMEWQPIPGTRIIFLDQFLGSGAGVGSGEAATFTVLLDVLRRLVSPNSGPFGLILWAETPAVEKFQIFLQDRLQEDELWLMPVFMHALRKADYINTLTGDVLDPAKLESDVASVVQTSPQLNALFSWEGDLLAAADAVLGSLANLVPDEMRINNDDFSSALGQVMYRISEAAAGHGRANERPREAINEVLIPLLADRILERDPSRSGNDPWPNAVVAPEEEAASFVVKGTLNTAIHIATPSPFNVIKPFDLGAVVEFPFSVADDVFSRYFETTKTKFLKDVFKAHDSEIENCRLRLVHIGAPCDQAQPKPGPKLYLLGVEWCFHKIDGSKDAGDEETTLFVVNKKGRVAGHGKPQGGSEWLSPVLKFEGHENPGMLSVFKNMSVSIPADQTEDWIVKFRMREQLIKSLTDEYSRYISRPGIVSL